MLFRSVEFDKLTDSPPDATFSGIPTTSSSEPEPEPITAPDTSSALDASARLETIVVFAFCVVEKPMLRTTKAKAAATITNAIITIADSTPMTPLWDCLCPFLIRFIGLV